MKNDYDVIVIGGGPGGAAASTLIAQKGHSVLLLERSHTPRFKIGESLMPATYWTLERMGVLPKMKESHFPKKHSVQFYNKAGKASSPFYFSETDPHESSQTWQVLRSEFDALLLDNARDHGVEVRRGAAVKDVLFEEDRAVGVRVGLDHEGEREISCRVVVDASGQSSLLARKLGLREPDRELRKASFFTHFEGAYRDPGIDEGATLVLHTEEAKSWFWYIPLPGDRVSVGVVGGLDHLIAGRSADPQQVFDEELAKCPALEWRIEKAVQVMPVQATKDFSYRSTRIAGDGWVLVGDAFGFLDPIYSSGVFLALKSGELAADSVHEALTSGDLSGERLGAHGPMFLAGMEAMRKLVYAFYEEDFSFSKFLARFPEHRLGIVNLLVGNVSAPIGDLFKNMAEMVRLPEEAYLAPVSEGAAAGAGR
jgi:flavin-dependent dehydrogenase